MLGILWALLGACGTRNIIPQSSLDLTDTPTTQPRVDITDLIAGQAPSYQGIIPGISHKRDVLVQWGEPNVIRTHEGYESLHYFNSGIEEYFLIKEDVVQAITSNAQQSWLTRDGRPITVDDLSRVLGVWEIITPTFGFTTLVFPSYGLAVSQNFVPSPYQIFVPMSFREYQALWGRFPLGYDPFPLIPSVESVGIKPGQTTRDQVAQLLGNPDRIVFEDPNDPWLYYIEPDTLGGLDIFFNADGIVEYMAISPYRVTQPLLLEDAVNQYGQPDMLQLIPGFEGQKYATLALLYLDRGLRVATRCITPICDIVKRDAVVEQKWYFQSTTLAEYQAAFPDPNVAYIKWHGFDE